MTALASAWNALCNLFCRGSHISNSASSERPYHITPRKKFPHPSLTRLYCLYNLSHTFQVIGLLSGVLFPELKCIVVEIPHQPPGGVRDPGQLGTRYPKGATKYQNANGLLYTWHIDQLSVGWFISRSTMSTSGLVMFLEQINMRLWTGVIQCLPIPSWYIYWWNNFISGQPIL